ncbi:CvpA family protein [Melaminivora sp.]|uniref:CvpA family protein n=1 Tax=Melaminivora sp. TaxID=1933032 RepID=UPI0028A6737F|nr:CvpA family protein [Melaminivora sp.]
MAMLDWVFLLVVAISVLIGAWRGLVFELLSLAGWIGAFLAVHWIATEGETLLPPGLLHGFWYHMASYAVVFVVTVFVGGLLAWQTKKFVHAMGLRPADRALGALFGVLRGVGLLLATALVAGWTDVVNMPWWQQSHAAPLLQQALLDLRDALPEWISRYLPSW